MKQLRSDAALSKKGEDKNGSRLSIFLIRWLTCSPFLSLNNIYKNILDVGRIYARVGEKFIYDDHHLRTCRTHQETWLLMLPAAHDLYGFLAHMPFFFNWFYFIILLFCLQPRVAVWSYKREVYIP